MRLSAIAFFLMAFGGIQAQRPSLSALLSLTSCRDPTCMGTFANSVGCCHTIGNEKEGWSWLPCDVSWPLTWDDPIQWSIGYEAQRGGRWTYILYTQDSTYASDLTTELHQLRFELYEPLGEGGLYRTPAYSDLEVARLARKVTNYRDRNDTVGTVTRFWLFKVIAPPAGIYRRTKER